MLKPKQRILEIDRCNMPMTNYEKQREEIFAVWATWDITKYFVYGKLEETSKPQNLMVQFEVRCHDASLPYLNDINDNYFENTLEPIFDKALERIGEAPSLWEEITTGVYRDYVRGRVRREGWIPKEYRGRFWLVPAEPEKGIDPANFTKGWKIGKKSQKWTKKFNSTWNFTIIKLKLPSKSIDERFGTKAISIPISKKQLLEDR